MIQNSLQERNKDGNLVGKANRKRHFFNSFPEEPFHFTAQSSSSYQGVLKSPHLSAFDAISPVDALGPTGNESNHRLVGRSTKANDHIDGQYGHLLATEAALGNKHMTCAPVGLMRFVALKITLNDKV